MENLNNRLAGCFGSADKKFAYHPLDKGRAFDLLVEMNGTVSWSELEAAANEFLDGTTAEHQEAQMQRVREAFSFWIVD